MNLGPPHDGLIVQRLEESDERVGATVIPDSAKEKPQQGKVLAGWSRQGRQRRQPSASRYQAGDTILFGKYSGQEIKLDGIEYLIMLLTTEAVICQIPDTSTRPPMAHAM